MSQMWRGFLLKFATWVGGGVVALSGVAFAAAVFPETPFGNEEDNKTMQATPASAPASLPATLPIIENNEPELGEPLGEFRVTFYVLTHETAFKNEPYDTPLYKVDGTTIGKFPARFVKDLRIQGSARLSSGSILAHAGRCEYEPGICYRILSRKRYPWGQGASGRALKVLASAAADPRVVPYGAKVYVPELDGVEFQGKTLDGCFSVDDTGGGIKGKKLDLFAGSRRVVSKVKNHIPTLRANIYRGGPHCGEEELSNPKNARKDKK